MSTSPALDLAWRIKLNPEQWLDMPMQKIAANHGLHHGSLTDACHRIGFNFQAARAQHLQGLKITKPEQTTMKATARPCGRIMPGCFHGDHCASGARCGAAMSIRTRVIE